MTLKVTALFNRDDKILKIEDVESIDILDPMDISLRIYQLRKLDNNWYEGRGKAMNQEGLTNFEHLFNLFYNKKLPLPAIFPKTDGNIQLEWQNQNKNAVLELNLESLESEFLFYDALDKLPDQEEWICLGKEKEWKTLNDLINEHIHEG